MKRDPVTKQLNTAARRIHAALEAPEAAEPDAASVSRDALEQLASALEELRVAQEELRLTNEELATARQRVEIERRRYQDLFDAAPDGYVVTTMEGTIEEANRSAAALLGAEARRLIGKPLAVFVAEAERRTLRTELAQLSSRERREGLELTLQPRHRPPVQVSVTASAMRDRATKSARVGWLFRDITERRRLERAQLEAESLADLNRRKDEFLAMLSHELRNPLAPILTAVDLLRLRKNDDPVQRQAIVIMERQARHLTHLVDDLLEVSRITTGRIRIRREPLDLRGTVERAVETVRPLIDQRQHTLSISLPPEPVWLQADPMRMEQVIVNLVTNAAKYTDPQGLISVNLQRDGRHAALRVRDTGVGIAADVLPRIFDLFTQAERLPDRSQGGLGIGLTLVERIVKLHGGAIEAHSDGLGHGSEFIVRLPMAEPPSSPPAGITPKSVAPSDQSWRVLVVDDNKDAADSVAVLLKLSGHDVRAAYTAQDALDDAVANRPDAVLLDIGLPEMDGYEVARRLRQHPDLQNVRLIAVSGYGQETDRERSRAAGFDGHLLKPVEPEKLQDALTTLMRG